MPSWTRGAWRAQTCRQISMISRVRPIGAEKGTPCQPSMTWGPDDPRPRWKRPSDSVSMPAAVMAIRVGVRVKMGRMAEPISTRSVRAAR